MRPRDKFSAKGRPATQIARLRPSQPLRRSRLGTPSGTPPCASPLITGSTAGRAPRTTPRTMQEVSLSDVWDFVDNTSL
eukprot:6420957-Prymnesium_polylepis.1